MNPTECLVCDKQYYAGESNDRPLTVCGPSGDAYGVCPDCRGLIEAGRKAMRFIEQIAKQKIGPDDDFPQDEYENADWEGGFISIVEDARRIVAEKGESE